MITPTAAQVAHDIQVAAFKAAPAAGGAVVATLTVSEWGTILTVGATVGYVALQSAYLLWKWRREASAKAVADD